MNPLKNNTGRRTMIHMSKIFIIILIVEHILTFVRGLGFKIYGENYERYEELKKYFEENPHVEAKPMERKERVAPKDESPWQRKF